MTRQVDLHALANMPGFGAARSHLIKAGLWDEYAGLTERPFKIKVAYSIRHDATEVVAVTARCSDEAIEKACTKIEGQHDYDVEIEDTEVLD